MSISTEIRYETALTVTSFIVAVLMVFVGFYFAFLSVQIVSRKADEKELMLGRRAVAPDSDFSWKLV